MWIYDLNPTLLHVGPLEIRWYGLVYAFGFFFTVYWLLYEQKRGAINLSKDEIWDFTFYAMLGVLIGSRLFMIFWDPQIFLLHPLNLFKFWEGGMSFHGGLVGIITASWLYCRKKKINFWQLADVCAFPAMIALALGRVANFINGELVGRIWNGSWCVVFPEYGQRCRHPNMIYSAGQRFMVAGWIFFLNFRTQFKPGFIFWNLVFLEGIGRFLMDFFREDVLYWGLSLGQGFSLVMIIISFGAFGKYYQQEWAKVFKSRP